MADLGTDLSCVFDLDPTMREVSGRTCLAQAMARRLTTPRGRLIYDPQYGTDLNAYLLADVGPGDIAKIGAAVQAECLKDERVLACTASVVFLNSVLIVTITLTDAQGPFTLTFQLAPGEDIQLIVSGAGQ